MGFLAEGLGVEAEGGRVVHHQSHSFPEDQGPKGVHWVGGLLPSEMGMGTPGCRAEQRLGQCPPLPPLPSGDLKSAHMKPLENNTCILQSGLIGVVQRRRRRRRRRDARHLGAGHQWISEPNVQEWSAEN